MSFEKKSFVWTLLIHLKARFWWTGTRDFSAWFAFNDAIDYRANTNGGEAAWLGYNKQLCTDVFDLLSKRWNVTRLVPGEKK